jgi:hypothetical protein
VLEVRIRKACLRVVCPDHGEPPKDIRATWGPDAEGRLQCKIEIIPKPCCQQHDDAIYAAFYVAAGARAPS